MASPGRSSSHAIELIFQPLGVRMNCVEMTPRPSIASPRIVPRFSYVLNRCAMFPKTSVVCAVSNSSNDVSAPESTILWREAMNASTLEISGSSELPEISSVDDFIASRQQMVDSGALTSFKEVETAETTEVFGNVAHRFSTYEKRGTMHGEAIEGGGLISTQFIRTPRGWKMSSMAWDDERPGLVIPDRYR